MIEEIAREKMVKTITVEWLQSKGACKESLEAWH